MKLDKVQEAKKELEDQRTKFEELLLLYISILYLYDHKLGEDEQVGTIAVHKQKFNSIVKGPIALRI